MEEGSSIVVGLVFDRRMNVGLTARLEVGQSVRLAFARHRKLVGRREVVVGVEVSSVAAAGLGKEESESIELVVDDSSCLDWRRFAVAVVERGRLLTGVCQRRSILLLP